MMMMMMTILRGCSCFKIARGVRLRFFCCRCFTFCPLVKEGDDDEYVFVIVTVVITSSSSSSGSTVVVVVIRACSYLSLWHRLKTRRRKTRRKNFCKLNFYFRFYHIFYYEIEIDR